MRKKDHLWFRINNIITCINKRLRKTSQIRKAEEKSDSNIVIKCIRNTHRLTETNWAKWEEWLEENIHQKRQELTWDNFTTNKESSHTENRKSDDMQMIALNNMLQ